MEERVATTRRTYDRVADRFLAHTRDRTRTRRWLDRFARMAAPRSLVLDVGAGPGFDTAELRGHGLRAVSVDLSSEDGTATTADGDYQLLGTQTLVFQPGETVRTVTVTVDDDNRVDGMRSVVLSISLAT